MNYISDDDIEDEVLKDAMQEADYTFASSQLDLLVTSRLLLTVADIASPLHLLVKEYVLAHAYARRAELNIGLGNRLMDNMDVYAYKHRMYLRKIEDIEPRITAAMITGISTSGQWSPSIDLYRA